MSQGKTHVENKHFDGLISEKVRVKVFLRNGISLRGLIVEHDDNVIILEPLPDAQIASGENLLYKSFIASVQREVRSQNDS